MHTGLSKFFIPDQSNSQSPYEAIQSDNRGNLLGAILLSINLAEIVPYNERKGKMRIASLIFIFENALSAFSVVKEYPEEQCSAFKLGNHLRTERRQPSLHRGWLSKGD